LKKATEPGLEKKAKKKTQIFVPPSAFKIKTGVSKALLSRTLAKSPRSISTTYLWRRRDDSGEAAKTAHSPAASSSR
jgi:hypothetical protein